MRSRVVDRKGLARWYRRQEEPGAPLLLARDPSYKASSKPARPLKLERLSRPASSRRVVSKEGGADVRSTSSRELASSRSREVLRLTNSSTERESMRQVGERPTLAAGCCAAAGAVVPQLPGGAAKREPP